MKENKVLKMLEAKSSRCTNCGKPISKPFMMAWYHLEKSDEVACRNAEPIKEGEQ